MLHMDITLKRAGNENVDKTNNSTRLNKYTHFFYQHKKECHTE